MNYKVLTQKSMYDFNEDKDIEAIVEEQNRILEEHGLKNDGVTSYVVMFDNFRYCETTIDDAIQCLALKEGSDLVQYPNGHLGYIGWYGTVPPRNNCFEIFGTKEQFVEKYGRYYPKEKTLEEWEYDFEMDEQDYFEMLLGHLNWKEIDIRKEHN